MIRSAVGRADSDCQGQSIGAMAEAAATSALVSCRPFTSADPVVAGHLPVTTGSCRHQCEPSRTRRTGERGIGQRGPGNPGRASRRLPVGRVDEPAGRTGQSDGAGRLPGVELELEVGGVLLRPRAVLSGGSSGVHHGVPHPHVPPSWRTTNLRGRSGLGHENPGWLKAHAEESPVPWFDRAGQFTRMGDHEAGLRLLQEPGAPHRRRHRLRPAGRRPAARRARAGPARSRRRRAGELRRHRGSELHRALP